MLPQFENINKMFTQVVYFVCVGQQNIQFVAIIISAPTPITWKTFKRKLFQCTRIANIIFMDEPESMYVGTYKQIDFGWVWYILVLVIFYNLSK